MSVRVVLGVGPGQCGLAAFAELLCLQPETKVTYEDQPLVPWRLDRPEETVTARIQRWTRGSPARLVGDAASSYLPHVEHFLSSGNDVRVVGLQGSADSIRESLLRAAVHPSGLKFDHWSATPARGWTTCPIRTRLFPKFSAPSIEEACQAYVTNYASHLRYLAETYPERVRLFDPLVALDTIDGQRALLSWLGLPEHLHRTKPGSWGMAADPVAPSPRPPATRPTAGPLDPRRCVILVPFGSSILPACDESLRVLERRGYPVRRVGGYAAIDQGRNQMATDALVDGFEETMWIDADIGFHPDAIERLRAHQLPMVCGVYSQKGRRALACHVLPGTSEMAFGGTGGLQEILYAATGFLHIRREVYLTVQSRLSLAVCNERFGSPTIPFFQPSVHVDQDGHWYLAEDYAFSQRVRDCAIPIFADSSIRLWHIGQFHYGWEDAGREVSRFDSFTLNFSTDRPPAQ